MKQRPLSEWKKVEEERPRETNETVIERMAIEEKKRRMGEKEDIEALSGVERAKL